MISADDGTRVATLDAPRDRTPGSFPAWAPDESGLDYVVTANGVSNIWRLPLHGGAPVQVTHSTDGHIFAFAWSPDGAWLSLARGARRSDVVLISRR